MFKLTDAFGSLCTDDGRLDDDGRDDVGDSLDELKWSDVWLCIESTDKFKLCEIGWIGRPFIGMLRRVGKSYGKNGFLYNNSGWVSVWKAGGKYGAFGDRVATCDEKMVGWPGAVTDCIALNSLAIVGGSAVVGTFPASVGDTNIKRKRKKKTIAINYFDWISLFVSVKIT